MPLITLCSRIPDNDLVAAECQHLTGGVPDANGVAVCKTVEHIWRAAYVHTGLRLLAEASTLEGLATAIAGQSFPAEKFRVEFLRLSASNPARQHESVIRVANAINAAPDLTAPQHRFLVIARAEGFWFGEIVAETNYGYHDHDNKPYRTSSSMPARLARAMVNLAVPPARSILDPCCGTGTILVEARSLGLEAFGLDKNPKMVGMSRRNLRHFDYEALVERGDARQYCRTVDAVVTDLPYGHSLQYDPANIQGILRQMATLAPVGIYLTAENLTSLLEEAGYCQIQVYPIQKRLGMIRYVHRARVER